MSNILTHQDIANYNYFKGTTTSHPEWLSSTNLLTNVGEDVGKEEPLFTMNGSKN